MVFSLLMVDSKAPATHMMVREGPRVWDLLAIRSTRNGCERPYPEQHFVVVIGMSEEVLAEEGLLRQMTAQVRRQGKKCVA
jgi:hypothetical protein